MLNKSSQLSERFVFVVTRIIQILSSACARRMSVLNTTRTDGEETGSISGSYFNCDCLCQLDANDGKKRPTEKADGRAERRAPCSLARRRKRSTREDGDKRSLARARTTASAKTRLSDDGAGAFGRGVHKQL